MINLREKKLLFWVVLILNFGVSHAQINYLTTTTIPENLKENANSIIRNQDVLIEIKSINTFRIKKKKIITVFNEQGIRNIDANENYSKTTKVLSIQATVYDAYGKEIKKIKQKDFLDSSVADGFSIFNDDRILAFQYTPINYPFTVVYESEVVSGNTAFIPSWTPIDDYYESVEKSSITLSYVPELGFKFKTMNFEGRSIEKKSEANSVSFEAKNLPAEKKEEYATIFLKNVPHVLFGLNSFSLEGVVGKADTWKDFGLWMNTLLQGTDELSLETQNKIKDIVGAENDPIQKARKVYQFVQDKTRYVSVQLGIGGWKPMLAKDVDRLGYGDCKALTNYTKALLKVVGVEAYYSVIFAGEKQNIDPDFVSMQGNHAVLAIPYQGKMLFLECTSQTKPFGFEGDFTDDRLALLLFPSGGELHRTQKYIDQDNSQYTKAQFEIQADGHVKGKATIASKGIQYDNIYAIKTLSDDKIKGYYASKFENLNNFKLEKYKLTDQKEMIQFNEEIELTIPDYVKKMGTDLVFVPNVLNISSTIPQRYRNRLHAFEIKSGYYDVDEVEITLPENAKSVVKPNDVEIKTKYGEYSISFVMIDAKKIKYIRKLLLHQGVYEKSLYEEFRSFREQITKYDNSKIIFKNE